MASSQADRRVTTGSCRRLCLSLIFRLAFGNAKEREPVVMLLLCRINLPATKEFIHVLAEKMTIAVGSLDASTRFTSCSAFCRVASSGNFQIGYPDLIHRRSQPFERPRSSFDRSRQATRSGGYSLSSKPSGLYRSSTSSKKNSTAGWLREHTPPRGPSYQSNAMTCFVTHSSIRQRSMKCGFQFHNQRLLRVLPRIVLKVTAAALVTGLG